MCLRQVAHTRLTGRASSARALLSAAAQMAHASHTHTAQARGPRHSTTGQIGCIAFASTRLRRFQSPSSFRFPSITVPINRRVTLPLQMIQLPAKRPFKGHQSWNVSTASSLTCGEDARESFALLTCRICIHVPPGPSPLPLKRACACIRNASCRHPRGLKPVNAVRTTHET